MLAHVARLAGKDDRRLALARQEHIGVAVHDREPGQVGDGPLEAGVLGSAHDDGLDSVLVHRLAHEGIAALHVRPAHHDRSNPFTSAQTA